MIHKTLLVSVLVVLLLIVVYYICLGAGILICKIFPNIAFNEDTDEGTLNNHHFVVGFTSIFAIVTLIILSYFIVTHYLI